MPVGMSEPPKFRRQRLWIGNWENGFICFLVMMLPLVFFVLALGVSAEQELYKLLGVSRTASIQEIKQVR